MRQPCPEIYMGFLDRDRGLCGVDRVDRVDEKYRVDRVDRVDG